METRFERYLQERLAELQDSGLFRLPDQGERRQAATMAAQRKGVAFVDASSNDYLGFAEDCQDEADVSRETGVQQATVGAGASRLIHGTWPAHVKLEAELAEWVQLPTALLFASGYAANVGLLGALGGPATLIISDRLNHASIIDGCRAARADVVPVEHLNLSGVEAALRVAPSSAIRFVVIESYFSMDGDGPDLRALRDLCDRTDTALVVDEAHALGVFGPHGAGRCREAGVTPDVLIGTLGKAVGSHGAFVAGSERLRTLLWNRARSFVFSTAPSPRAALTSLFHVQRTRTADVHRARLLDLTLELRAELQARNIEVMIGSFGPIVPVLIRDNSRTVRVAARLAEHGILTQGIRPPSVPAGTARLRVTVKANWPRGAAPRIAMALAEVLAEEP